MSLRSFRELEVWQVSMRLVLEVYPLTLAFSHPHRFELGRQMRDAAVSVPANIAEGYSQRSRKVYVRHLNIAAGSTSELDTQLELVRALSIGDGLRAEKAAAMCDRVGRMLNVLVARLSQDPPGSGWAFSSVGRPCVAHRVCPMPYAPVSGRSRRTASRLESLPALRRPRAASTGEAGEPPRRPKAD